MIRQINKIVFPRFPKRSSAKIEDIAGLQAALDAKQNALGFTPENVANKQNSLATDGTGNKYPTVDVVNEVAEDVDFTLVTSFKSRYNY
jgi:hypothetical protein